MLSLFSSRLIPPSQDGSSGNLNSNTLRNVPPKGTGLPVPGLDDFNPAYSPRKERLHYVRPLTGATFSIEMPYLESIEEQDILDWKRRFLESAEICGWSVEHASDYLLALSSLKIRNLYGQQNNPSLMLQALIQKKYPLNSAERYHAKLMEPHQNKFHDIADLATAIDSVLVRWAAATKASSELVMQSGNPYSSKV